MTGNSELESKGSKSKEIAALQPLSTVEEIDGKKLDEYRAAEPSAKAMTLTSSAIHPKGPDGGTITVLNPYNLENGSPDGKITMSLKQFKNNFSMLNIEDPTKAYNPNERPQTIRS